MVCTDKSSVYYCNSRSSPARSPAAWWWTYVRTLGQSFYCARVGADVRGGRGGGVGGRLTLLWKVRSVIFFFFFWGGRPPVALSCRCFRCTNKGLDGVVGTERQWRAGGLFTIITPSRWRHVIDSRLSHSLKCLAISNTLYLESGYIIEVQQRPMEGGTSAGIFQFVVQNRDNEFVGINLLSDVSALSGYSELSNAHQQ